MSKMICIDPGHGGYDPGACGSGAQEKDITLRIGLQLRDLLRQAGFRVVMTRETDTSPGGYTEVNADLRERCRISNAAGTDVFLSIHVNAGGGSGAEIYVCQDGGPIAGLARRVIGNVSSVCGTHGQAVRDGGPQGECFAVLCGTEADAMLVEVGFIDSGDLPKIRMHLDEFAPQIARAFCSFYGVAYPDAKQSPAPALDPVAAGLVIAQLGALTKTAAPDVLTACNCAANAIRRAAGLPVAEDLGRPSAAAADRVKSVLGALWMCADGHEAVQQVYHAGADALRALSK